MTISRNEGVKVYIHMITSGPCAVDLNRNIAVGGNLSEDSLAHRRATYVPETNNEDFRMGRHRRAMWTLVDVYDGLGLARLATSILSALSAMRSTPNPATRCGSLELLYYYKHDTPADPSISDHHRLTARPSAKTRSRSCISCTVSTS